MASGSTTGKKGKSHKSGLVRKAVILAGGAGTRLRPVTLETPKPLLTVKKVPILSHLVEFFVRHGVEDITVLISRSHQDDFLWWRKRYPASHPKQLRLVVEDEPMGTFGGLRLLSRSLKEPFFLSNGDELKEFDLKAFADFHFAHRSRPHATLALVKVPDPSSYGVPIVKKGVVTSYLEKPTRPPSSFINSGIYLMEPEIFSYADPEKRFLMNELDIFPRVAAAGRLAGFRARKGRWYDCGTLERWEKAIREW